MPNTPQHNVRVPVELWDKVETEAASREIPNGSHYPRSWIVNEALTEYFTRREAPTPLPQSQRPQSES